LRRNDLAMDTWWITDKGSQMFECTIFVAHLASVTKLTTILPLREIRHNATISQQLYRSFPLE
jgi:hypothetical protein